MGGCCSDLGPFTCLGGVQLGAVVLELWPNEPDGVLHRREKVAHALSAARRTGRQDGLDGRKKLL